jgi:hypothetical protein
MTGNLTEPTWTRLTKKEKEAVRETAKETGMSMAAFVRFCIRKVLRDMGKLKG